MFKIVSTGWNCQEWIEQTLRSVEMQTISDWEIQIMYDGNADDGAKVIVDWYDNHADDAERWHYVINANHQQFACRNQFEAIQLLDPADDDIIVWLDLDGDMLAHPHVLEYLKSVYADNRTLLTYGSYKPIPFAATCPIAEPYPADVIANNSYRAHIVGGKGCCFNHLRTMKGVVAKAIPEDRFKWPDGSWYVSGQDYLYMVSGLELAGGRHKFIPDTLLLYNNANPHADYLAHPADTAACDVDLLSRPSFEPLVI